MRRGTSDPSQTPCGEEVGNRAVEQFQQVEKIFVLSAASDTRISAHTSAQDHDGRFSSALSETIDLSPVTALVHSLPCTFVPSLQPAPGQNTHVFPFFPALHESSRGQTSIWIACPVFVVVGRPASPVFSGVNLLQSFPDLLFTRPECLDLIASFKLFVHFVSFPLPPASRSSLVEAPEHVYGQFLMIFRFTIVLFISPRRVTIRHDCTTFLMTL